MHYLLILVEGDKAATLSKYRRIIKLPDAQLKSIVELFDKRRITFEAAYIISRMEKIYIKILLDVINKHPDREVDVKKLKELLRRMDNDSDELCPISREMALETLVPKDRIKSGKSAV